MDEIVSKWGLGSGVGLFIIAGISQQLIGGVFTQIIPGWISIANGGLEGGIDMLVRRLILGNGYLAAIATTVIIFSLVVYFESTKVEIPVQNSQYKGGRGTFPIKLIYASVLPLILIRAVQANIQFIGRILNETLGSNMPAWLGIYNSEGDPVAGLFYYFNPIYSPEAWLNTSDTLLQISLRILIDGTFLIIGGAVFAVFWVETTEMGGESTAKKLLQSNMQIPGFRQNPQIMERVVNRYIPAVTMLGGAIVGFFALFANLIGTIGGVSGTGLLLSVSITYRLFESAAEEYASEKYERFSHIFTG